MLKPKEQKSVVSRECQTQNRLMLFELSVGGHYPEYITHLVKYWCEQQLPGILDVVVSPKFLLQHSDVVKLVFHYQTDKVKFITITLEEEAKLKAYTSGIERNWRAFQEFDLICKYVISLEATKVLVTYFDTRFLPLVLGKSIPCPFSGIYFRPTFHYDDFAHYHPTWQDRLQQWREKLILSRVLQHPQLETLFCLDPFAIEHLNQFDSKVKVVHIPDPVQVYSDSSSKVEELRASLGVETSRQVFLLFGDLSRRKGINQLLEAIALLPTELCQKLCLLFVGSMTAEFQQQFQATTSQICTSLPVQIICRNQYIPERDIQLYFQLADVILAPYQRHVGMSGILIRAAAAQKPVLSSDYGLMGEITRRYQLGLTVDSTQPSAIAQSLNRFLTEMPTKFNNQSNSIFGNRTAMKLFAEQSSPQRFAHTIFEHLHCL